MHNWKKIENLNLKDIASKTQIEIEFLESLINRDFEKISRFNVKGFIKILSREYELDFSDFNEEYQNYLEEKGIINNSKNKILTAKLDSYSSSDNQGNFLYFIVVIVVVCVICIGIYYYDYLKDFFREKDVNSSVAVIEIIDKAKDNVDDLRAKVQISDNLSNNLNLNMVEIEENITSLDNYVDENFTKEDLVKEEKLDINQINKEPLISNDIIKDEVIFSPKSKIWVGIIELKNGRKISSTKDGNFSISLKDDKLILTGSTQLTMINENGEKFDFKAGASKRFLIRDGKIKNITMNEFLKYNKGKGW